MSKQNAFFLLSPEYIVNENAENYHIFTGYHDTDTDKWTITSAKSVCRQVEHKSTLSSTYRDTDEKRFHHKLIDLQGKGKNICGQCMAHFFADD